MAEIPSGIGVWWPSGSIPGGWARNTDFDARFLKGTAAGVDPNVTGGSTTHVHTSSSHTHPLTSHNHSFTTGSFDGSNAAIFSTGGVAVLADPHSHGGTSGSIGGTSGGTTPTWNSTSTSPAYYTMIYIVSDGTPAGFPDDCVLYYNNASDPTDWTQHSASVSKFITGPAGGASGGGSGSGAGSHVHTGAGHTHSGVSHDHASVSSSTSSTVNMGAGSDSGLAIAHTHTVDLAAGSSSTTASTSSGNPGATSYEPLYHTLNAIQNDSGADNWLEDGIVMWTGTLSDAANLDDWELCDGSESTPDLRGRFIKNSSSGGSVGGTSGDDGHTHTAPSAHTHTSSSHTHTFPTSGSTTPSVANIDRNGTNAAFNMSSHTHGSGTSGGDATTYTGTAQALTSNADTQPAFRTVAFLQAPEEPEEPAALGSAAMFGANF